MTQSTTPDPLFEYHGGLHLRNSVLWFDAPTPHQLCFISHAAVPCAHNHQKILATNETSKLLHSLAEAHGRGRRVHEPQALVSPFGRPFSLGQLSLELFPSGHILGSSSLLVRHQGISIVYAGQINPHNTSQVHRLEARPCQVLVLSCQYGQRRFVFPPFDQTAGLLVQFVQGSLSRGRVPIIFCTPLGGAQEVALLLKAAGIPCRAHRKIYAACKVYGEAGFPLEDVRSFSYSHAPTSGEALLWPIRLRTSSALDRLPAVDTAFVSGMALDSESRERMRCDASFALSAQSDYPGLLEYVKACEPEQIILTRGAHHELLEDIQALGMQATSIGPPQQMDLF